MPGGAGRERPRPRIGSLAKPEGRAGTAAIPREVFQVLSVAGAEGGLPRAGTHPASGLSLLLPGRAAGPSDGTGAGRDPAASHRLGRSALPWHLHVPETFVAPWCRGNGVLRLACSQVSEKPWLRGVLPVAGHPRGRLLGLDVPRPPRPGLLFPGLEDHEPCWPACGPGDRGRRASSWGAALPSPDFPAPHPVAFVGLSRATPAGEQAVGAGYAGGLSQAFLSSEMGRRSRSLGFCQVGGIVSLTQHLRAVGPGSRERSLTDLLAEGGLRDPTVCPPQSPADEGGWARRPSIQRRLGGVRASPKGTSPSPQGTASVPFQALGPDTCEPWAGRGDFLMVGPLEGKVTTWLVWKVCTRSWERAAFSGV